MIAEAVYVLCMLTSLFCAVLLLRSYRRNTSSLLLYSTLCFFGLAISNALLVVDLIVLASGPDLGLARTTVNFVSGFLLLAGLVWEMR